MSQDIRDIGDSLHHWHPHPAHPGYAFCYVATRNPFRVYIARKSDFKVLGSFAGFASAEQTMHKLYDLEATAS